MPTRPISFVTVIWHRNGIRLRNYLASLLIHQDELPTEVIIVDCSTDPTYIKNVQEAAAQFPQVKILPHPSQNFRACWAYNVGIKNSNPASKYVATSDVDLLFSSTYVKILCDMLDRDNRLILTSVGILPENADVSAPFERGNFQSLVKQANCGPGISGNTVGAVQAASREWWFSVQGYDESFDLGNEDNDILYRAKNDNLQVNWVEFGKCPVMHQWHPWSPWRKPTPWDKRGSIKRNHQGWGEP